jgi:Endoglucanase
MRFFIWFTALFLLLNWQPSKGQAPFNRGVNLTNWFQTNSPQQIQFRKYTKKDFENIKSLGCDVVRLPINMFYMTSGSPAYTVDTLFFSLLDQVVTWAEDLNLYLLIDNHSTDDIASKNANLENVLSRVWLQVANHYKSRSGYVLYEIMNEPNGITTQKWGQIQQTAINTIRSVDTLHTIVVGGSSFNSYNELSLLPVYSDKNLIYTFHFYDPFLFTHQGASWVVPSFESLTKIPFPYNADSIQALPSALKGTWVESTYNSYPTDGTLAKVKQLIDVAAAFKSSRNVNIYCGEFGVYKLYSKESDRVYWYGEVRKYLEAKGIPWTTWDYQAGFGLFKSGTNEMFDYDLDTALVRTLGFNVPVQSVFEIKPDTSGIVIYDDYMGPQITESSYANGGKINYYFGEQPNNGKYCLYWTGSPQYSAVEFNFLPDRDLSTLVSGNYALRFMVRGNVPGTKIEVRFTDTKTTIPGDHPWRMNYTVTESLAAWDGKWHKVSIPLKNFIDQGSYDNGTWYNPIGAFDWTAVDKFEIVTDQGSLTNKTFCFDNIIITNVDTAQIYDKSTLVLVSGLTVVSKTGSYSITTTGGTLQMQANVLPSNATNKTVLWSVSDTTLATIDSTGLLKAKKDGAVTVIASSKDGWEIKGTSSVTISGQTNSVSEVDSEQDCYVYPVPVNKGILNIRHQLKTPVEISVYNIYGQRVIIQKSDEMHVQLDVSSLIQGSYLIKISNTKSVFTKRFIVK